MDRDEVAKRDGKARRVFNISEQRIYKHTDYDIILGSEQIEPTGLLVVASLKPKDVRHGQLPKFVLRWDEKANVLDVDSMNTTKDEVKAFKDGTNDYYGHHPKKIGSSPRKFDVCIGWNGHQVYHGKIAFSIGREVDTATGLGITTSINVS